MPLRFTFRQLEYLVAVGDVGTIAMASQKINVSSPSISAAISQLEAEFGIQLFVRHHAQGLSLTPGGRRVYNAAKHILNDAGSLSDLAAEVAEKPRGPISLGALTTLAPMVSASLRRSFETDYPDAAFIMREGNQTELLHMLGRAEIDVALTYDLDIPKDVVFEPLISLPPIAILPADHVLASQTELQVEELAEEPMILLDLPISRDYFLSLFHKAGLRANIAERTSQMSVAQSLVANGYGFGLTNMHRGAGLAPDGEKLAYVPLTGDVRPMIFGIATKQTDHRSRLVSVFFDHVRARVEEGNLPGLSG
ncbi:MAG: LysR substrate-binding domain-containing protein [Aliishimia sp.]